MNVLYRDILVFRYIQIYRRQVPYALYSGVDSCVGHELSLFGRDEASKKKSEKFEMTMDEVRKKYGNQAIGYASVVKNDMGIGFSADREDDGEE